MASFERFDICEAWYLYLSTHYSGMGDPMYARLCKLLKVFTPKPSLRRCNDLSSNGLEIYLRLVGAELPFVDVGFEGHEIFEMWAGASADTKVLVRADSFESAFEVLVEWLDDNAPGCLTQLGDHEYQAAAEELGLPWGTAEVDDETVAEIVEHAEADLTVIGHTQLKNGTHIASYEWGGSEVAL